MIFVNSPLVFRAIWQTVKPWLHPVTAGKTRIVGSGSAILKEFENLGVPLDQIPENLGGTCKPTSLKSLLENWRIHGLPGSEKKAGNPEAEGNGAAASATPCLSVTSDDGKSNGTDSNGAGATTIESNNATEEAAAVDAVEENGVTSLHITESDGVTESKIAEVVG